MANGDSTDIAKRLRGAVPASWFSSDNVPVFKSVLAGFAAPLAWIYQLYSYTLLQMRIGTVTGVWIDRVSYDFLGTRLPRRSGEADDVYRGRVKAEIMRPRQTRAAVALALKDLTGVEPQIFEPWNPNDCGAYGMTNFAYSVAGCYGSLGLNNQMFITAVRPQGLGIPNVPGYGVGPAGYSEAGEYIDNSQITGPITDDDIYRVVRYIIGAGMTAWVSIVSKLPTMPADTTGYLTADNNVVTADDNTITADRL